MASFDFSEFSKWREDLNNAYGDFDKFLNDFMLTQGLKWLAKTKPRTPVDTGALRADWHLSNVRFVGDNVEIDLINSKLYASYQEYGSSRITGKYMATVSLNEVMQEMPSQYTSKFTSYLASKGVI